MARGIDVSAGFPYGACDYDGWWRCEPGYLDASATDPWAEFDITQQFNINDGTVSGFEVTLQHLFEGTPFGMQVNYTKVTGGDVEPDTYTIGDQFILSGFGDSGNLSGFFENEKHTFRLALNYRAETAQGFANYKQPVFVDERHQIDASYQYRHNESITMFFDAQNITDESTRLWVRHPEMLFLSQDHGPIYKFGVRANF
jgi:outer membrane receptor protein involved in Fe transport